MRSGRRTARCCGMRIQPSPYSPTIRRSPQASRNLYRFRSLAIFIFQQQRHPSPRPTLPPRLVYSGRCRTGFRSFRTAFRGDPDSFPAALSGVGGDGPERTSLEGSDARGCAAGRPDQTGRFMARKSIAMRQLIEILRLNHEHHLSVREIARNSGIACWVTKHSDHAPFLASRHRPKSPETNSIPS